MTPIAIIMMVVSMVAVWGGLALSIVHLARHPEAADAEPTPPVEL